MINKIIDLLKLKYPIVECGLKYNKDFELIIAARLSAQCSDKMVNHITKKLFINFKTLNDYANIKNLNKLKNIIKPCGLYNIKALQINKLSNILIEKYNYKIPNKFELLIKLPGIGNKTANLILGTIFKKNVIICDTHCIRLSNKLNLVNTKNPLLIEKKLKEIIPSNEQKEFCHRLVQYGREICNAKKPKCNMCILKPYCITNVS